MQRREQLPHPGLSTLAIVASAILGGTACTIAVTSAAQFKPAAHDAPIMLAWLTLLAAQGAVAWAGMVPSVWIVARTMRHVSLSTRLYLGPALGVLVGILIVFSVLEPRVGPLPDVVWPLGDAQSKRVAILSGIILIPPTVGIAAMWFTAAAALEAARVTPTIDAVDAYLERRDRIEGLLAYIGIVVGAAVLSTGVLRQAMLDGHGATPAQYPATLVLAYGAFFTLVLIISYVPAYVLLRLAGLRLISGLLGARADRDVLAWNDDRKKLVELLELDRGLVDTLKSAVAIVAPIVGGLASVAIA